MRNSRRAGSVVLHAALAGAAPAAVGCGEAGSPAEAVAPAEGPRLGGALAQCEVYRRTPNAFGFCVYKHAGGLPTIEDLLAVCAQAGEWELDCRHAWVAGRMKPESGVSTEDLLRACGASADCGFELIDARPDPDPLAQLERCTQHAGPYARDCARHAIQRWWLAEPDAAEFARVAGASTLYPEQVGYWLAVEVQCYGKGACEGNTEAAARCQEDAGQLRERPESCPARERAPLRRPQPPGVAPPNR